MGSPSAQQQGGGARPAREAGDRILQFDGGLALADGRSFQAANLSQPGPIQMFGQTGAGLQLPFHPSPMPLA